MSGIYIHIPFCKQACHYCDFHFSTSMKKKEEMILALAKEIELRKKELGNDPSESEQAKQIIETTYFGGGTPSILEISDLRFLIDMIYGITGLTNEKWQQNIQILLDLNIPHISSYALTVEPKTALATLIKNGKIPTPDDGVAHEQFLILVETLENNGFVHYELSNFGKPDYFSQNNSAYWLGKKYLGMGPSAHSYDGKNRSWNIANNSLYLKALAENVVPLEVETLTTTDRYNEYIMTGLRTVWGVSLERIEKEFGTDHLNYLLQNAEKYLNEEKLQLVDAVLKTTNKGKFFCDGIASDLFFLNLD